MYVHPNWKLGNSIPLLQDQLVELEEEHPLLFPFYNPKRYVWTWIERFLSTPGLNMGKIKFSLEWFLCFI